MRNKHQGWLSSNTLTEYPNDRILILNSVGTVDSEQPAKVKIKGNVRELNKQTPGKPEKKVYYSNITDKIE